MATIEREHEQRHVPHDHPVFVSSDGRRARRLRLVASAIALLALLWLAALAAGMFGFGRLPGISTPVGRIGGADNAQSDRSERKIRTPARAEQRSTQLIADSGRSRRASVGEQTTLQAATRARRATAKPAARRPRAPAPPGAAQPVQPQPVAPPPQQGWARHGRPAPPGYTRRTEPQPAPPPPQASAPGQVKKALPPPPPPPPPGNGGGSKKP